MMKTGLTKAKDNVKKCTKDMKDKIHSSFQEKLLLRILYSDFWLLYSKFLYFCEVKIFR